MFGEAFVTGLVTEYARRWPETRIDVVLTRRRVDLVAEQFDAAFRVGKADDATLSSVNLGAARVLYCASPAYIATRGAPSRPEDLKRHHCIVTQSDDTPAVWPFPGSRGPRRIPISPSLKLTSFAMAYTATLAGLGVGLFPEFACADDLRARKLVAVLGGRSVDVGAVWLLYPARRPVPARLRAFIDVVRTQFRGGPPWVRPSATTRGRRSNAAT